MRSTFSIAVSLVLLAAVVWMVAAASGVGGDIVQGQVVAKEEAFAMPGGDTASHVLKVTYRFQPADSSSLQTGANHAAARFAHRERDRVRLAHRSA